ncbi:kynureninase [Falsibacillus albus]|uniref:Kynureninase n=1 Tax=Falsibacillus albus TaxID=2478915 RepID=A0A3L7JRF4_9BACI|nr:kynureninase [Falsibacillus albus]RLQ93070.1 kynureninase [Falsibacillus albus]
MKSENYRLSEEYAKELDSSDPLKKFKQEFYVKSGQYYMDGNSLGLLSKRAETSLMKAMDTWRDYGIDGWTQGEHPWFYLSESLGEKSAPLIGAKKEEVIVTGSITTNIHQMVSTFFKPSKSRNKILADELTFPSDIYALKSQLTLKGLSPEEHLIQVQSRDGLTIDEQDIIGAMTDDISLILLPSVMYRSGQLLDMKLLTKEAHKRGIFIGFDLAHSIGAIPHSLHEWNVDFAVWCNYKYLNSGPGGVGGLYVHESHLGKAPGLAGWFSSKKDKQFDMEHTLDHSHDAGAFQIGTPHVLSCAPLLGSLELFEEAGIENLRQKSLKQTRFMMELIKYELNGHDFEMVNPSNDSKRGGHICLQHKEAARICKALKDRHVIPDFRAPNMIRLAPIAFYSSYQDIWRTVQILKEIMEQEVYLKYENKRDVVA